MSSHSKERRLVRRSIVALTYLLASCAGESSSTDPFALEEATIHEVHQAYLRGRLTALQLTTQYLTRIEAHDQGEQGLHTVSALQPDALERAQSLDEAFAKQHALVGPLHGIPVLVEESLAVLDVPSSTGASAATSDAVAVAQLRRAGAIILGRTARPELAATGDDARSGPSRSPYDRSHGASAGSAAAVAANLAMVAVGVDSQGSLATTSAANGVVSIRASFGLVSGEGLLGVPDPAAVAGPIARTVEDAVVVLEVISGRNLAQRSGPLDATGLNGLQGTGLEGARIALVRELVDAHSFAGSSSEISPSARDHFIDALGVMRAEGANVSGLSIAAIDHEVTPLLETPDDAARARALLRERLVMLMDARKLDGLVYLSIAAPGADDAPTHPRSAAGQVSALSGLPSVTLPLGTNGGLPLGLTMLARPFQERKLFNLAFSFEQSTHYRKPPALD